MPAVRHFTALHGLKQPLSHGTCSASKILRVSNAPSVEMQHLVLHALCGPYTACLTFKVAFMRTRSLL